MSEAAERSSEKSRREEELIKFRADAREFAKQMNLGLNEVEYWEGGAREILDTYGSDFGGFVEGHETLVDKGEDIIKDIASTGFNLSLILGEDDFPIESEDLLIFYSCYIDMPEHFGILLAAMKKDGCITNRQVRFSKKATEVIIGDWKEVNLPQDKYVLERKRGEGVEIGRSVETVVIFSVGGEHDAYKIIKFLLDHTDTRKANSIPGSWQYPDIRISQGLKDTKVVRELVSSGLFRGVISNILITAQGKLLVLRLTTKFRDDLRKRKELWSSLESPVNEGLARFVAGFEVGP